MAVKTQTMLTEITNQIEYAASKYRGMKERLYNRSLEMDVRTARVASVGIIGVSLLSVPVAADPLDDIGQAMCGSGLGQLFGILLAGLAIYLLAKAVVRGMMAFDKLGSDHDKTQFQGKQQLVGSGKTAIGAFVPVLAAGVFEVIGINTVSCFNLDLGILYIGFFNLPL